MKILLITPYYAPAWGYGGPPLVNSMLAKYLASKGHCIEVLTTDAQDQKRNTILIEEMDNVTVRRFRNVSNYLSWNFKLFLPIGFQKYIKKNITHFDFVYISDLRDYQNIITYKLCLKHRIPYGVSGYGQIRIPGGIKAIIKKFYDVHWGQPMIQGARLLFGQTENECNDYLMLGATKNQCKILPLAIDLKDFNKATNEATIKKYLNDNNLTKTDKIILFVGRLNYLKGIDRLIKIMPKLVKKIPDAKLVIIGRDDGYYKKTIEKLVSQLEIGGNVRLLDPLYGADNHPAYLTAKLYTIMPRYFEETSLASLAALATGVPVITATEASIPYLEKYKAGYEIEYSPEILLDRLELLLNNGTSIQNMKNNAKKLASEVFDLPCVGKRLEQLIFDAINEK